LILLLFTRAVILPEHVDNYTGEAEHDFMASLLSQIQTPEDLRRLSLEELQQVAAEIRDALCRLLDRRAVHFASNLGVVELAIALHSTFDFLHDRLIWDTGHQIYPHKMLTGRFERFNTIRSRGGLMGYPNPQESPYDLFITGHVGCSVGSALGLTLGDALLRPDENRHSFAVIGDGAFGSGSVFEALNHAGWVKKNLTVILNDNKMSICPRVGGMSEYLDRLRMAPFYVGMKQEVQKFLNHIPLLGGPTERFINQVRAGLKAGLLGGMIFEEIGFRYIGPVDGHNIEQLREFLQMVRKYEDPVLLHVVTEKGHGYTPAVEDPTTFHSPTPEIKKNGGPPVKPSDTGDKDPFTLWARNSLLELMKKDERICVITAAMCQGNMLEPIRETLPERFFDVGICESHAVILAAGLAKAGMRPVVDVYSTFLQRSYDQIFQEVSLANLPITLMLDRAGLTGPDGPTHHGVFDLAYLRPFPNLVVMAPGDGPELAAMLRFAQSQDRPVAVRYPKAAAGGSRRRCENISLGTAEILRRGKDGAIACFGGLLGECRLAAEQLADEGIEVGLINARFLKPLDTENLLRPLRDGDFLVTVEEGMLAGGFGSAVLEAACEDRVDTRRLHRLGIGDTYVPYGERKELLAELGLDADGIAKACRHALKESTTSPSSTAH
jgi:1-deoxy-D-xylulose-5-phosphate synthase